MLKYSQSNCLPSSEELPDSDDTPVDNELQNLIPGLLKAILALIWSQRQDWFFGVDMGVYYDTNKPAIVPDGFLQQIVIKPGTRTPPPTPSPQAMRGLRCTS